MNPSWRMTRLAGIDLHIHWTLAALVGWMVLAGTLRHGLLQGAQELLLACSLFACVVLHELGHALAARHYGIGTHDITLLPIGGVASLERIPRDPRQELVIALAGPAVNAALLLPLVPAWILWQQSGLSEVAFLRGPTDLLGRLVGVNAMLILFNLIPAFPMDGGRVLRAVLALRDAYINATRRAVAVGKFAALGLMILGLFWNPMLVLIGLFVMISGEAEYQHVLQEQVRGGSDVQGPPYGPRNPGFGRTDASHGLPGGVHAAAAPASKLLAGQELLMDPAWPAVHVDHRGIFRLGRRAVPRPRPTTPRGGAGAPFDVDYGSSGPSCA
jgi:Zn-dependent protease